jgi:hypothetical protein
LLHGFELTRDGGLIWHGARENYIGRDLYAKAIVKGLTYNDSSTAITASSSPSARVFAVALEGDGAAPPYCKQPRYPPTGTTA